MITRWGIRWRWPWTAVAAVAAIQTLALVWMVGERISLLMLGREVVLPIIPVDPRSLFRGDYVRLGYQITRVPASVVTGDMRRGEPVYVTIERQADGSYKVIAAGPSHPGTERPGQTVLRGQLERDWFVGDGRQRDLFVRYGIESYFVPEGKGRTLEDLAREKKLSALIAVDRRGNAAIKGLMIEGRLVHEEPLF